MGFPAMFENTGILGPRFENISEICGEGLGLNMDADMATWLLKVIVML